jgi:uncharacterized protein YjbI with pentapeptide repeats
VSKLASKAFEAVKPSAVALKVALERHRLFLAGAKSGKRLNLAYADLTCIDLPAADLAQADFTGAKLGAAMLRGARLREAVFYGADLDDADLRDADLSRADLRGARLRGANLSGASMVGCDMRPGRIALKDDVAGLLFLDHGERTAGLDHAVVDGADLRGARLFESPVDLTEADLSGAVPRGCARSGR